MLCTETPCSKTINFLHCHLAFHLKPAMQSIISLKMQPQIPSKTLNSHDGYLLLPSSCMLATERQLLGRHNKSICSQNHSKTKREKIIMKTLSVTRKAFIYVFISTQMLRACVYLISY